MLAVQPRDVGADLVADDAGERDRGRFHEGDAGAESTRRRGDLRAEESRTDDDEPTVGGEPFPQGEGVLQVTQHVRAGQPAPGQPPGPYARRDQDGVPADVLAVREGHGAGGR
ncbi:hypothetical protein GA0115252_10795 [Streptomyces sp. DfronAA-171]|nr:hypothetical protein GA0115252_10795 [Streptomyces sp. DfronAA-171]